MTSSEYPRLRAEACKRPLGHVVMLGHMASGQHAVLGQTEYSDTSTSVWFGGATWQARFKQTSWTNGERLAAVGQYPTALDRIMGSEIFGSQVR